MKSYDKMKQDGHIVNSKVEADENDPTEPILKYDEKTYSEVTGEVSGVTAVEESKSMLERIKADYQQNIVNLELEIANIDQKLAEIEQASKTKK